MSAPYFSDAFNDRQPVELVDDITAKNGSETRVASAAVGFLAGTRVATPMGYVVVERLCAGDAVLTADGRHAKLLWVGMTQVAAIGANAPVRFETGVMDNIRPLRIGQGHRVRISGWRAELLFDTDAVLAKAGSFVNQEDVGIEETGELVTYVHLMFDRHEIILAENVACETLRPGPEGIDQLDDMTRRALLAGYPGSASRDAGTGPRASALPLLTDAEALVLLAA